MNKRRFVNKKLNNVANQEATKNALNAAANTAG